MSAFWEHHTISAQIYIYIYSIHEPGKGDQIVNLPQVGGFNPFEKYLSNWIISPGRDENKKYLETPPRCSTLGKISKKILSLNVSGTFLGKIPVHLG